MCASKWGQHFDGCEVTPYNSKDSEEEATDVDTFEMKIGEGDENLTGVACPQDGGTARRMESVNAVWIKAVEAERGLRMSFNSIRRAR